ncbi:MAG: phytoene/squalene synthase family protein [Bdellovibrionota bacterium]
MRSPEPPVEVQSIRRNPGLAESDRQLGFDECYSILREHGKTFYVMAKLLGPARGRAIAAIYGFARTADDTVDVVETLNDPTPADKGEIERQLDFMKMELRRACDGRSLNPRYAVLGETINQYGIELFPFDDLLSGVAMDLTQNRYATYEELKLYCYRVAGTIGLMITPVAGYVKDTRALDYAKTLGTAFQLTNILRDVGEDLARGRIYLPKEDLDRFGISENDLLQRRNDEKFHQLMEYQIERAFELYRRGLALIPLVSSWGGRLAFQFAVDAYSSILHKIRENKYDVYTRRAHLTLWEKLAMIPGSWWRAQQSVYRSRFNGQQH